MISRMRAMSAGSVPSSLMTQTQFLCVCCRIDSICFANRSSGGQNVAMQTATSGPLASAGGGNTQVPDRRGGVADPADDVERLPAADGRRLGQREGQVHAKIAHVRHL